VFQWHEEAFDLPAGAAALATSQVCTHQAFAIGPHLAMQFHVEVDEDKLHRWSMLESEAYQALQQRHTTVQSGAVMRDLMAAHLPGQQALADRIYERWLAGVVDRGA
jgi:GMP synthase-like glutamine amidotransferase